MIDLDDQIGHTLEGGFDQRIERIHRTVRHMDRAKQVDDIGGTAGTLKEQSVARSLLTGSQDCRHQHR